MQIPANPYRVLGIPQGATAEDIRSAWRRLSRNFHPDRNPSPQAAEQFRAVQEAWTVLSDPARKARCDEDLRRLLNRDPERTLEIIVHDYLEGFSHASAN